MRRPGLLSVIPILIFVLLVCVTPEVQAQAARVKIVVHDIDGKPVEGVVVTITNPDDEDYVVSRVTDKKGRITVTHIDSQPTYTYKLEKEGFQILTTQIRSDHQETAKVELILLPLKTGEVSAEDLQEALAGSRALAAFNEGTAAQEQGDLELAAKKFQEAAKINPGLAEPHIALAVVAHQRGDFAVVAAEAESALAINPSNEQSLLLRYDGYRMLGNAEKTTEAAEALRGTAIISAASASVFNEGLEMHKSGQVDEAVIRFRQAIELDPELVVGYVMLGSIAMSQGDYEQAAAMASKAVELDPSDANGYKVLYDALRYSGDAAGATEALEALIETDPEWAATDLFNHAVELYNGGQMVDAVVALATVINLQPDDAKAHFLLGMAQFNLGVEDEAKTHLSRFLELAPDDADAAIAKEMLEFASR